MLSCPRIADSVVTGLRITLLAALAGAAVFYVRESIHRPLLGDSQIMHSVNFLMDHGMRPYGLCTSSGVETLA